MLQVQRLKNRYNELQPVLLRIQNSTGLDGQQKLLDENQFLRDALQTIENQVSAIHSLCIDKQQAWMEFKLRFDTTRETYNHTIDIYQQNSTPELDQLKVIFLFSIFFLRIKIFKF